MNGKRHMLSPRRFIRRARFRHYNAAQQYTQADRNLPVMGLTLGVHTLELKFSFDYCWLIMLVLPTVFNRHILVGAVVELILIIRRVVTE